MVYHVAIFVSTLPTFPYLPYRRWVGNCIELPFCCPHWPDEQPPLEPDDAHGLGDATGMGVAADRAGTETAATGTAGVNEQVQPLQLQSSQQRAGFSLLVCLT